MDVLYPTWSLWHSSTASRRCAQDCSRLFRLMKALYKTGLANTLHFCIRDRYLAFQKTSEVLGCPSSLIDPELLRSYVQSSCVLEARHRAAVAGLGFTRQTGVFWQPLTTTQAEVALHRYTWGLASFLQASGGHHVGSFQAEVPRIWNPSSRL